MSADKQPPSKSPLCALSDEFDDAVHDGKTLAQAVIEFREDRGYGDGGWGEYLATKIEQQGYRMDVEAMAKEQFSGLFDWSKADQRFDHLCGHTTEVRPE